MRKSFEAGFSFSQIRNASRNTDYSPWTHSRPREEASPVNPGETSEAKSVVEDFGRAHSRRSKGCRLFARRLRLRDRIGPELHGWRGARSEESFIPEALRHCRRTERRFKHLADRPCGFDARAVENLRSLSPFHASYDSGRTASIGTVSSMASASDEEAAFQEPHGRSQAVSAAFHESAASASAGSGRQPAMNLSKASLRLVVAFVAWCANASRSFMPCTSVCGHSSSGAT